MSGACAASGVPVAGVEAHGAVPASASSKAAPDAAVTCDTCSRCCRLAPGQLGFCRARRNVDGAVVAENYGRVTSLAIDPIEKKPLARFHPGSTVLSVGSYGCNMRCPFCQNHEIAQAGEGDVPWREVPPEELVALAEAARARDPRMIGIAYTYNEPLVGWEYVRDCARLAHERGLVNVLVSNGCAEPGALDALAGLVDAANIDLKAFDADAYRRLGGDFTAVRAAIERLAADPACHLEITTLIVPGMNDDAPLMDAEAAWLASLPGDITLHVTRFFPRWHMVDAAPTPVADVYALAEVARRHLAHVYTGNC